MIIIWKHGHIGPHVVHNHREPLKHGVNRLTREISEILVLSPEGPIWRTRAGEVNGSR
jgi:hypothetical protein